MNSNNQMIQKGKISSVEGNADRNGDKPRPECSRAPPTAWSRDR